MEKHRCKLCLKSFANGRALGGHMRSHMVNLYVPPKAEHRHHQLDDEAESASSSSASDAEEEEENREKDLLGSYGLRENPKKSIRLVDPEFSFAADVGSVVLQDRESETESSKNPVRRRSKRIRKSGISEHYHHRQCQEHQEIKKKPKSGKTEPSWAEQEPVSSISDATTEEDVAYCLMMLSRDKWMRDEEEESEPEESNKWLDEDDDQTDESEELKQSKGRARGKCKCETCHKVFRSYQALGGHRASHKKSRGAAEKNIVTTTTHHPPLEAAERRNAGTNSEQKTHECPVCFRVFSSGQALGGHKRSHALGSAPALPPPLPPPKPPSNFGELLIDLNLPAPIDEDDISQIELSAVSDAQFVEPHQALNDQS